MNTVHLTPFWTPETFVSDIVKKDFRTVGVFEKYAIDFCCKGKRQLQDICQEKGIVLEEIMGELAARDGAHHPDYQEWETPRLIEHIVTVHHGYVKRMLPQIESHTQKIVLVHGERNPELKEIAEIFNEIRREFELHMMKEEHILFPYILKLDEARYAGMPLLEKPFFGTVVNPITMMEYEHEQAGEQMYRIRELSSNYAPPANACTTYKVTFQELEEFERDLHQHVYLENNILHAKAIQLEQALCRTPFV